MTPPTFVSLFAGVGGLDLGLERAGWRCIAQVEVDPFCRRVLAKHWPDVPRWGDIREVVPDDLPRADLVCGGFPCQPVSTAGKRRGQDDERWLWPEFARIVRHLRPRWVLLENVPGLLVRGMGDVLGDLAASGYDAEWDCIPAAAVGAPHLRYRVFIVAYPSGAELREQPRRRDGPRGPGQTIAGDDGQAWAVANPNGPARRPTTRSAVAGASDGPISAGPTELGRRSSDVADTASTERRDPQSQDLETAGWGTAKPGERRSGGGPLSDWWATEPDVGRVAHGVPARVDRLRALGNAVVPQVAEHVGRLILAAHHEAVA